MAWTECGLMRLYLLLYPFTALAVAVDIFMLGLVWQVVGLPAISPVTALWLCILPGALANRWVARWVRGLMNEAEGRE